MQNRHAATSPGTNSDRLKVPETPFERRIHKLVLTGGPCGGKTTGQSRLAAFFEQYGWKVFCVPEAASVLFGGGLRFGEMNEEQQRRFQKDLLKTLLQLEKVYFKQAELIRDRHVLVVCDRGALDPSAYMSADAWLEVLGEVRLRSCDLREGRYNQVVHMVTAADGAALFYNTITNVHRTETAKVALEQDRRTRNAWVGHPYVDIVDNMDCASFEDKIRRLIQVVAKKVGLPCESRLNKDSKKRKWLVSSVNECLFPKYEEFEVRTDYLMTNSSDVQVRLRERSQAKYSTFTITHRFVVNREHVETRAEMSQRQYTFHLTMKDPTRATLVKKRRCFLWDSQYFHLDVHEPPLPPAFRGQPLMILETYTTKPAGDALPALPDFVKVEREVTTDENFCMYTLAKVEPAVSVN